MPKPCSIRVDDSSRVSPFVSGYVKLNEWKRKEGVSVQEALRLGDQSRDKDQMHDIQNEDVADNVPRYVVDKRPDRSEGAQHRQEGARDDQVSNPTDDKVNEEKRRKSQVVSHKNTFRQTCC